MKRETKQALAVFKLILLVLWPVSAWAATVTFGEALAKTQLLSILMTFILSTVMGATALLHAMIDEYTKKDKIDRLWLFVSSKMLSSNAAGLVMFFSADSLGVPTSWMAGAVMVASFGGTTFIQWVYNKHFSDSTPEAAKP